MRPDLLDIEKYMPTLAEVIPKEKKSEDYWINYVTNNKEKETELTRLYNKIKTLETFRGLICLLSLIISQVEYEFYYYQKYYIQYKYPDELDKVYKGTYIRCGLSVIALLLVILSLTINYTYHLLKREQKKETSKF